MKPTSAKAEGWKWQRKLLELWPKHSKHFGARLGFNFILCPKCKLHQVARMDNGELQEATP